MTMMAVIFRNCIGLLFTGHFRGKGLRHLTSINTDEILFSI